MSILRTFRRLVLGLLLCLCLSQVVWGQQCKLQSPAAYEQDGFVVSAVSIESTDKIFNSVQIRVKSTLAAIPLKPGNLFTRTDLNASKEFITADLSIIELPGPMYTAIPQAIFVDCNTTANPHTVKIVFDVSFFTRPANSPIYEQPEQTGVPAKRPALLRRILSVVRPQPYVGFTSGKNLAGLGVSVDLKNELLQSLSMEGAGGSSSTLGAASVEGSRNFAAAWLRTMQWRGGYEYSSLPTEDGVEIKRGTGYLQLFATTRSFKNQKENAFGAQASREIVFRYGVSLEGGNRQTNLDPKLTLITDVVSGNNESLKAYIGSSWRLGRHTFKTSYGLQMGGTNAEQANVNVRADFLKHIFDSAYKTRFFPWANKPMSVEAQFTAGRIVRRGSLPVAERFFGGNIEQNLIAGGDWTIRSAPFIRSFPQLSLSRTALPLAVGGERFISLNTTFAATFLAKPAIPREAQREIPVAFEILKNEPKAEPLRIALTSTFVSETASYVEQIAKAEFDPLKDDLSHLKGDLEGIVNQGVPPTTEDLIADCDDAIVNALEIIESAKKILVFRPDGTLISNGRDATLELQELVIGFPPKTPTSPRHPAALEEVLTALEEVLKQSDGPIESSRPHLNEHKVTLQDLSGQLTKRFNNFQTSGLPEARAKAIRFLEDTQSQIETVGRELNAFSLGPIFMFDAARLRTRGVQEKFRYGVGSGLQIEFFGLALRAGYSFNPDRRPGESRGAFTFGFEVLDVLR